MQIQVVATILNDSGQQIVSVNLIETSPNDPSMIVSFQRAVARLRELREDVGDKIDRQVAIATEAMGG